MEDQGKQPESETIIAVDREESGIMMSQKVRRNNDKNNPKSKQGDELILVDKNGDVFSNFFSNFYRQFKNPSRFNFFKVSEYAPEPDKKETEDNEQSQENSNNPKNDKTMENTPNTETEYRYTAEQIDWKTMEKLDLSQEKLEKFNALDPLLRGFKTNTLVPVTLQLGSAVSRMDVRLSLQPSDTDGVPIQLHAIRREPNLNLKFLGYEFTDEDKKNLMENGNMGRVVDGVRKGGLNSSRQTVDNASEDDSQQVRHNAMSASKGAKLKHRKSMEASYDEIFFRRPETNARDGKPVYIHPEFHEKLTRIIQVIGEDKISIYAYLDNLLEYHFLEFGEQITKSYNEKHKPIL